MTKPLLEYLREDGIELRKDGHEWLALCPFHNEKTPSFKVNPEKGDGGFYYCHGCGEGGDAVTWLEKHRKLSKKEALRLHKGPPSGERMSSVGSSVRQEEHKPEAKPNQPYFSRDLPRNAIAIYDYRGADGKLKFKVAKLPPKDGRDKDFRALAPRKKDGVKGWLWKQPLAKDRPLYRLPELLAADPSQQVMVVEGEKCVHAVLEAFPKVVVTTWSHGSKSWRFSDFSPLYGRDVILVSDADEGGRKAMTSIAEVLAQHQPKDLRVAMPLGDTGDDIADEIEKGGAARAKKWLKGLAKDYEPPKPEVADAPDSGKAADKTSVGGTADAPNQSEASNAPDTPDVGEIANRADAAAGGAPDTLGVGESRGTADMALDGNWIEALLEQAKTAPGAPFEPHNLEKIRQLMHDNMAAWENLRADLRDKTKVRIGKLDEALKRKNEDEAPSRSQGKLLVWRDDEPWEENVDGAELLNKTSALFRRYIQMSQEQADALAVWLPYSWIHDKWVTSTFLGITSATRRCGKTTLTSILKALALRPISISTHTTSPALFRTIEKYSPTVIFDEIDRYIHTDSYLMGLLNGSHEKDGAFALRMIKDNDDFEPGTFDTWCPKILAGIGAFPSTIRDRSIMIKLKRRSQSLGEMQFWGDRDESEIGEIRQKLARWTKDNIGSIYRKRSTLEFPSGFHDRARDCWAPLITIGEQVGGDWAGSDGRVWRACETITATTKDDTDIGEMLLEDIRKVFHQANDRPYLPTGSNEKDLFYNKVVPGILPTLIAMEGRPWQEYTRDRRPLTPSGLAKRLKPFDIAPTTIRINETTAKGYKLEDFVPVWERYEIAKPEEPPDSSG